MMHHSTTGETFLLLGQYLGYLSVIKDRSENTNLEYKTDVYHPLNRQEKALFFQLLY